jgi:hypothetical protein
VGGGAANGAPSPLLRGAGGGIATSPPRGPNAGAAGADPHGSALGAEGIASIAPRVDSRRPASTTGRAVDGALPGIGAGTGGAANGSAIPSSAGALGRGASIGDTEGLPSARATSRLT